MSEKIPPDGVVVHSPAGHRIDLTDDVFVLNSGNLLPFQVVLERSLSFCKCKFHAWKIELPRGKCKLPLLRLGHGLGEPVVSGGLLGAVIAALLGAAVVAISTGAAIALAGFEIGV